MTPSQLLQMHARIAEELRSREITRSENNPAGDYAEYLFCRAFGWKQAANSVKSYDALDATSGARYQIKSRRLTERNTSRQLSALRELDSDCFDYLAGVLFEVDFKVLKAAIISYENFLRDAKYGDRTNSWRYFLRDAVWTQSGTVDVTEELRLATT
ncbi:MAG: hypothetical protein AAFR88_13540 [Pseudomonadota bacterium]